MASQCVALNTAQTTLAKTLVGVPQHMEILDYLVEKYSGQEFTTEELQTDEDLMDLFKTKKTAVKKRSTRGAKSSEERVKEDYDSERCDCRVFLNGFGGQCTHKKVDGCMVCKHHGEGGKWSNLVDEDGLWWLGMVTGPRPENPVRPGGSGKPKVWRTSETGEILEKPVKPKKPKMSSEEKEALKAEKKAERDALKEQKKAERDALKEQKKKEKEEEKEQKKKEKEEEKEQKKKEKEEKVDKVLNMDLVQDKELDEDTEDLSDVEQEEESEYDDIIFEGVEYQCHKESKEVLDPEDFSVMGTWNTETESIDWEDDDAQENHESKKKEL